MKSEFSIGVPMSEELIANIESQTIVRIDAISTS